MQFPPTLWDISSWIGVIAIILLVTSEIVSSYYGETGIVMEENRLRMVALFFAMLFTLIVLIIWFLFILTFRS